MTRSFTELQRLKSFDARYDYLRLRGAVGETTFGFDRYLNQIMYSSGRWRNVRDEVIIRDNGCDLGDPDYLIHSRIVIHHMNPVSMRDIQLGVDYIFDSEYLICTSNNTHLAIHYGDESLLPKKFIARVSGDTRLWR